jgi:hypothetical protein
VCRRSRLGSVGASGRKERVRGKKEGGGARQEVGRKYGEKTVRERSSNSEDLVGVGQLG